VVAGRRGDRNLKKRIEAGMIEFRTIYLQGAARFQRLALVLLGVVLLLAGCHAAVMPRNTSP
jgi:hypothetical protein